MDLEQLVAELSILLHQGALVGTADVQSQVYHRLGELESHAEFLVALVKIVAGNYPGCVDDSTHYAVRLAGSSLIRAFVKNVTDEAEARAATGKP